MKFPGADAAMLEQPFTGCKVALFLGDRLVTLLRDNKPGIPWPGMWDLPGGGREGAETPLQTLRREVSEEIGLDLPASAVVWARPYLAADQTRVWFFVARMSPRCEADIIFGDEGQAWALMTPEDFVAKDNVIPIYAQRLTDWRRSS